MRINNLSIKQLLALKAKVDAAIEKKTGTQKKQQAAREAAKIARKFGFTLSEIVPFESDTAPKRARRTGDKRRKVSPKYQNPNEPYQKWSGRGRQPKWVIEHLDAGGTMDSILIKAEVDGGTEEQVTPE